MTALSELGELNFLLSDGVHLLAFANTRLQQVARRCQERGCRQQVAILATTPLSDEGWRSLEPDRLHVFQEGQEATVT